VLRLAIGNIATTWHDLEQTWDLIQTQALRLRSEAHDTIQSVQEDS